MTYVKYSSSFNKKFLNVVAYDHSCFIKNKIKNVNIIFERKIYMKKFEELLKSFDLKYFGTGQHKIGVIDTLPMVKEDTAVFLDVRTKEETNILNYSFAYNIPLNELPERISELSKEKMIAIFCGASARAAMASMYLQVNGYEKVKLISENNSEIASLIKPGFALKKSSGKL